MGLLKSSTYLTAHSTFFPWVIFFVRPRRRLSSAPTAIRSADARRGCQGWPSLRRSDTLHGFQATPLQPRARRQISAIWPEKGFWFHHVATASDLRTHLCMMVGTTMSRGARCQGSSRCRNLVFGESCDPNHDACMRIGGEAPRRRTHSVERHQSHGETRDPATSNRHRRPVASVWTGPKLSGVLSARSLHCAERRATPSGTTPSRTKCQSAISSLRARATIMVLREPRAFSVRARYHCARALLFWNMRKRHAN